MIYMIDMCTYYFPIHEFYESILFYPIIRTLEPIYYNICIKDIILFCILPTVTLCRLVVYRIFLKYFFGMRLMKKVVSVHLTAKVFYLNCKKRTDYIGNI